MKRREVGWEGGREAGREGRDGGTEGGRDGGIRGRESKGKGGKGRERDRGRGEGGSDRGRGVRSINNVGVYIYAAQNNVMSIYQRPTLTHYRLLKKSLPWYASDPSS